MIRIQCYSINKERINFVASTSDPNLMSFQLAIHFSGGEVLRLYTKDLTELHKWEEELSK